MDLSADITQAVLRAETKRQIADLLEELTATDRKAVLLDLLAESGVLHKSRQDQPAIPGPGRPSGRATNGGDEPVGRTDTLLATLAAKPGTSITDLAKAVYGSDDDQSRNKVRSLLSALNSRGRVKNVGPGQWEVATPKS